MKIDGIHVNLRLVNENDAEFIINLRLKYGKYLSETDPNIIKQAKWINLYKQREKQNKEYYFIIQNKTTRVGTIRIYDINHISHSFTFGSFIVDKNLCHKYSALESIIQIFNYAFTELKLEYCYFDCRKNNNTANNFYIRLESELIKEDNLNYYYRFNKESFMEQRDSIIKLLNNGNDPQNLGK